MGGPCAEHGCEYVGVRMLCYIGACGPVMSPEGPWAESSDSFCARSARCSQHDVEHKRDVHGETPVELFCTGCKKPLGLWTDKRSRAGAPWCGGCSMWWHGGAP